MADRFEFNSSSMDSPATRAFSITPSDSTDLSYTTRALYTGAGGTIVCILANDASSVTFTNVPAGTILPLRVRRVLSTGTTSGINLVGLE